MATIKIVTWSRADKDGNYPIGFKISNNGKPTYIFEGHTLPSRDLWDAKKQQIKNTRAVPNAARLTNYLTKRLSELRDKAIQLQTDQTVTHVTEIKYAYKQAHEPIPEPIHSYFNTVADQYLEEQKACGNREAYLSDRGRLNRFYEFAKNEKLTFPDVTVDFLRRYQIFLKQVRKQGKDITIPGKPLSEHTIVNHLMIVRTIYNRAITAKLASKDDYPFGGEGKISIKKPESSKIGLDETEIQNLESVDLSELPPIYNDARNIWLTEYMFAGMRVTDCLLLKWTDFQNGRLYYQMSKNGEHGSVKVPAKAISIIEQYKRYATDKEFNKHSLIFPYLMDLPTLDDRFQLRRRVAFTVSRLNKAMKKIMEMIGSTKNASQHKARHSFAQRAEIMEIHPKVLQKMYRHESILTTMKYQSTFSHDKIDAAMDAVIGN
ncbi:tyrosine-type recombinase/integrase [Mucilaginibacter calamicampi]|uniref:Tyrosine-type recombinase/integrase n=1 Tax=Mucilaginibacter calamicampi TaxID=1302352 RepID=A0ABW2Z2E5_9SPHI